MARSSLCVDGLTPSTPVALPVPETIGTISHPLSFGATSGRDIPCPTRTIFTPFDNDPPRLDDGALPRRSGDPFSKLPASFGSGRASTRHMHRSTSFVPSDEDAPLPHRTTSSVQHLVDHTRRAAAAPHPVVSSCTGAHRAGGTLRRWGTPSSKRQTSFDAVADLVGGVENLLSDERGIDHRFLAEGVKELLHKNLEIAQDEAEARGQDAKMFYDNRRRLIALLRKGVC